MSYNRYDLAENKGIAVRSKLLYISTAKYGSDWPSSPHAHHYTELFYVTGGTGGFHVENTTFQVKVHDLVIINPNVQHTETSWNTEPLEYIVLGVDGLELTCPDQGDGRYFMTSLENAGDTILPCLKIMLSEAEKKLPGADSVCQNILQAMTVQLLRIANMPPESSLQAARRECATAKWYLDLHFKERITLDMLAEICGVNKYYLSHSFTSQYGLAPIQYLSKKRLDESKYLLRTTDLPLGRIVHMLGFSSASYFTRMFRAAEGMTPSAYRASRDPQPEDR